jgi:cardiolipin synthase
MIQIKLPFFSYLPVGERKITISTAFTIARMLLTPIIVFAMISSNWAIAFWLFLAAAATDVIDGFLARMLQEQTLLGAYLDPVADKLLVLSCFTTLAFVQSPLFGIPLWFVLTVLCKELILIGGFAIVYMSKGHLRIKPTLLGKVTTCIQIGFIVWLFACYFCKWIPIKTYYGMLGLMLITIIASLVQYIGIGISLVTHDYL